MVELFYNIGNIFQNIVLVILVLYLMIQSRKATGTYRHAVYFMAGCFFCQVLGLGFWTLCLLIQKEATPVFFSASDVSSIGAFLFLISTYSICLHEKLDGKKPFWLWIMPIIVLLNTVMWIVLFGSVILNLMWGIPMTALAWYASYGIWQSKKTQKKELLPYCYATLIFIVVDLILFVSPSWVYDIMNFMLTFAMIGMAVTLERGVRKCCI